MIQLKLVKDDGRTCTVNFNDCEAMGEPDTPVFSDATMHFPWDSVPNQYGHMPQGIEVSPTDFKYKAELFGFTVEVL